MKIKVCSVLLLLAMVALAYGETINELVAKGCPSPDREWQAKDYAALSDLLIKGTMPLPRLDSESGRLVLRRFVDTGNLSFHRNRNLPVEVRVSDLLKLVAGSKKTTMLYFRAASAGQKVEREVVDLLVFQLATSATMIELAEEYIPTIPKDAEYETRMAGAKQMKSGLTTVLDGAITSLSERTFYSDESVAKMVRGIREYYPRFSSILSDSVKTEFRLRINDMLAKERNPSVKQELGSLKDTMKDAPTISNALLPIRSETNRTSSAAGSPR
jgi:hypothetical protein